MNSDIPVQVLQKEKSKRDQRIMQRGLILIGRHVNPTLASNWPEHKLQNTRVNCARHAWNSMNSSWNDPKSETNQMNTYFDSIIASTTLVFVPQRVNHNTSKFSLDTTRLKQLATRLNKKIIHFHSLLGCCCTLHIWFACDTPSPSLPVIRRSHDKCLTPLRKTALSTLMLFPGIASLAWLRKYESLPSTAPHLPRR